MPADHPRDARLVRTARLTSMRLRGRGLPDVASVVGDLLAVQGQELQPALWGVTRRVEDGVRPRRPEANRALASGEMLRTHVLRPTWHLVRPDDARWLLELTAPRIARLMASTEKSWSLGDLGPGTDAVAAAVADGPRTRVQIKEELVARGVLDPAAPGIAFTQMLMHAELDRVVISGPPTAGQPLRHQVYATFDDRVPPGYGPLGELFDPEAAVVELWRRYLPARGFATVNDLRHWSDVTVTALKRGLAVLRDAGEVVEVPGEGDLEGLTLVGTTSAADRWLGTPAAGEGASEQGAEPVVDLLQAYDELLMSYRETRHVVLDPDLPPSDRAGAFVHSVAVDGVVAGRWRWPADPAAGRSARVDVQWSRAPSRAEEASLARAVIDLEDYLEDPP